MILVWKALVPCLPSQAWLVLSLSEAPRVDVDACMAYHKASDNEHCFQTVYEYNDHFMAALAYGPICTHGRVIVT